MDRFTNLIIASIAILILSPVLVFISIAILVTSGRPVFFMQQRIGLNRVPFKLIKFRTMTLKPEYESDSFDAGNTSRVTSIGKILRKTKMDEIPQLFNIIKGNMALVGPRPEVLQWTQLYPERWDKVLSVLPGITDPSSIAYRNEEEILSASENPEATYRDEILPRKLSLAENYVDNRSYLGDIKIVFQTLIVLFR